MFNQGRGSRQFESAGRWFNSCRADSKRQWAFPRAYGHINQAGAANVVLKLGVLAMKSDLDYEPNPSELSRAVVVPIYKASNVWRCIL